MRLSCCGGGVLATLARAAAKAASARLRRRGVLGEADDWARRAQMCERCPMRVIHRGGSYCGPPFLHKITRDPAIDGCGCPCLDKAKDPTEHCPVDERHRPARRSGDGCTCKWCGG